MRESEQAFDVVGATMDCCGAVPHVVVSAFADADGNVWPEWTVVCPCDNTYTQASTER